MARFKNLPREIRPGTCTMFRAMGKVRVRCVSLRSPTWADGQPGAEPPRFQQAKSSCCSFLTHVWNPPTPFIRENKQKPPLSSLCFSSKHCGGQSACRSTCSESPAVTLWLLPEELRLPRPGSCVGDERTSRTNGSWFIASLRRTRPLLDFGSVGPCW